MTENKEARLAFNYYGNCISMIDTKQSCKIVFEELKLQAKNTLENYKDKTSRQVLLKDLRATIMKISVHNKDTPNEMNEENKLIFMSAMMSLMLLNGLDNTQECGIIMYEAEDNEEEKKTIGKENEEVL